MHSDTHMQLPHSSYAVHAVRVLYFCIYPCILCYLPIVRPGSDLQLVVKVITWEAIGEGIFCPVFSAYGDSVRVWSSLLLHGKK